MISKEEVKGKLSEMYRFRFMFYSLVKKSLYGKYKNSALGFLWNFITPVIMILLLYVVFETIRAREIEYFWAYLCVGMFPFTFMNSNLIGGASNIISNGGMIKKMYFPREILSLSQVTYTFIVFVIAYMIVIALMAIVGVPLSSEGLLALPVIIVAMFFFSLGTIMFTSSISVYSRDFEYFITATARVLFWVTPIFYMTDSLTGILNTIVWINPLTYYVEGLHDIIYRGIMPSTELLAIAAIISAVTFIAGAAIFQKLKDGFAERL